MKKRLLSCLVALCMLTAVITPVAGTWATEEITPTVESTWQFFMTKEDAIAAGAKVVE